MLQQFQKDIFYRVFMENEKLYLRFSAREEDAIYELADKSSFPVKLILDNYEKIRRIKVG